VVNILELLLFEHCYTLSLIYVSSFKCQSSLRVFKTQSNLHEFTFSDQLFHSFNELQQMLPSFFPWEEKMVYSILGQSYTTGKTRNADGVNFMIQDIWNTTSYVSQILWKLAPSLASGRVFHWSTLFLSLGHGILYLLQATCTNLSSSWVTVATIHHISLECSYYFYFYKKCYFCC
jgi:hypothetical protein